MEKTGKQLRKEREQRIMDTIALKPWTGCRLLAVSGISRPNIWAFPVPPPIMTMMHGITLIRGRLPISSRIWSSRRRSPRKKRWKSLTLKPKSGPATGVYPYQGHQAIEIDNLKADEYEAYMHDTSDFLVRTFLPRTSPEPGRPCGFTPARRFERRAGGHQDLAVSMEDPKVAKAFNYSFKSR